MTRAEARQKARRRDKRRHKIQRAVSWTIIYAGELLAATIPTALTAAILIPLAYKSRGYQAFGGEWLVIGFVFCFAYRMVHKWLCSKIFEEE